MFKRILTVVLLSLSVSANAFYNSFNDYPPSPPYTSYDGTVSEYDYERYRSKVKDYVESAERFIEEGNDEIESIQDEQRRAADSANEAVRKFNSWSRSVTVKSGF